MRRAFRPAQAFLGGHLKVSRGFRSVRKTPTKIPSGSHLWHFFRSSLNIDAEGEKAPMRCTAGLQHDGREVKANNRNKTRIM